MGRKRVDKWCSLGKQVGRGDDQGLYFNCSQANGKLCRQLKGKRET
jgi:hypothetical protein